MSWVAQVLPHSFFLPSLHHPSECITAPQWKSPQRLYKSDYQPSTKVERTHTMPPKSGIVVGEGDSAHTQDGGKKAKEQEARKQRAAEREKAKGAGDRPGRGRMGSAAKGKGKAKGTKRKAGAGGSGSGERIDEQDGAGAGGSGSGDTIDEQERLVLEVPGSGERIDEQDGAGAGGSGSGKEGDEQETAAAGGSGSGKEGDEQETVSWCWRFGSGKEGDEQETAGAGGSGSGKDVDEQDGAGAGGSGLAIRAVSRMGSNRLLPVQARQNERGGYLELEARPSGAIKRSIKLLSKANDSQRSSHGSRYALRWGGSDNGERMPQKFDEVDSFAQSAIYQWVKNDDERHFKGVIPFSLRQFNLRGIDQSVFDDLYNKGKELLTQSPEHAIIIALPGRIVNKEKSFPSPLAPIPTRSSSSYSTWKSSPS
ncbi:hypothetical protein CC2G_006685 [Coprinopsis cinerea AmutBmut pab1-1]|nr:hypothetical protein CC2G_006685 [Coprinopsis cinerea AmutBmut pab1-1]